MITSGEISLTNQSFVMLDTKENKIKEILTFAQSTEQMRGKKNFYLKILTCFAVIKI